MANEWYCSMSGDVSGPLTGAQLKELAAGGYLSPDDLVRKTAEGGWVAARRVTGLFAAEGSPSKPDKEALAAASTEAPPAARLPVAKAVGGPPPIPPANPPIRQPEAAPGGGLFTVDADKTGTSVRSRSRKGRRRLITSPSFLAISVSGIVLGGVIFWLSRTETQPARAEEDASVTEAGSDQPVARPRKAAADTTEGLDMDELDKLISRPLDGPRPARAKADTKGKLARRAPDKSPEESVPDSKAVAPAEPSEGETPGPRETMVKVLEDDGYSPIPIPGLTNVDDGNEKAKSVEGVGGSR